MKKIAFVNYHPVDSQVVRYVGKELTKKGYQVKFYFSEKENIIEDIIKSDGFDYKRLGTIKSGLIKKIFSSLSFLFKLTVELYKFNPSVVFSPSSIYTGIPCMILRKPLICWADTETANINLSFSLPFISSLLVSNTFQLKINNSKKEIRYFGYKEIAYCHPNWFTPNPTVLKTIGIKQDEKIVLMRFSALKAMHDIGLESYSENKTQLLHYIKLIEKHAKVFISMTEKDLGKEFEKYKLNIHPAEYIHLLAHCTLYIGEGTTTASEAGVLGIPWIALRPQSLGYLNDQEFNYDLGFRTDNIKIAFIQATKWIQDDSLLSEWRIKKEKLLNDKLDVSAFFLWFIENYPQSHKIMRENPEFQNRFK